MHKVEIMITQYIRLPLGLPTRQFNDLILQRDTLIVSARPPRPVSVKLPTIVHRISLEDPKFAPVDSKRNSFARGPEPPRTPRQISFGNGSSDDYVNTE